MSNIRVALRVRPLNEKEKDEGSKEIVKVNKNSVRIENDKVLGIPEFGDSRSRVREFLFDHIYDCMQGENALSSQLKVFGDLGTDVLKAAFDGFNACVFAYGQTGTGKTHTMMGYPGEGVGLIPRICEGLFTHMSECTDENLTSRVEVSYFEIYNERVRDLLQPEMLKLNENYSLKVREHPKDGPYVKDLSWHRVKTNEDIQTLLEKGNKYRVTAETYVHGHSSRSHAIVTVCYTQARLEENRPSEIVSKINLVDLAGSERADPSSKPDFRKRLTEGANINKSLVTLGYVIKALAERSLLSWSTGDMGSTQSFHSSGGGETGAGLSPAGPNKQRVPYIPYRDSVLTWLLRDSLGGNSKTIMIATITPASQCYSESISTLRYAQRAKNIINKPRINEDTNVALIRELRQEIERLHRMLATAQMPASQLGPSYLPGDIVYFVPDLHRGQDDPSDQQSGSMVTLPESEDAIIAEKLHENEEMAKQLTQSWMCKWSSTHDIMKESDLSIRGLNQSSSMGVMIDSQLPYLIGMDDDVLSTGVVIFHLKEGNTLIGGEDADTPQDIVLHGPTIQKEHCVIRHVNGEVYLHPCPGSLCAVQDIECTEPTKLSQGDYVILGGNQTFRFNNPSEAAKLRENRRSQGSLNALNTSHLSFGGLSRASSYSSIGGDDSYYLSPPQLGRSYPNSRRRHSDAVIYAAPDLCRDLERRYQSEQERIAEASKELERLKAEHERAEELRQLKEEEMYMTHEQHRADIEDQKQHLLRLKEENERERAKAEEELRLARESLAKEKEAFQRKLEEERKALRALKKIEEQQESMAIQTDPLSFQSTSVGCDPFTTDTMSVGSKPLSMQTVSTGSEQSSLTTTSSGEDSAEAVTELPIKYKGGRRVSADDQLDDLAQTEFTQRMSYRETEESLAIQQEDIEDAYLQTQAQLEDKLRKIQKMEEEYKEVDKAHLQEMEAQTEKVQEIRKQEVQLEVYIQENKELCNVREEKPQPLRTACSEMFLLDPSIQDQEFSQKTTSLLDIQGADSEEQLSPRSRRLRRSSSADSIESGISEVSKNLSMEAEKLKAQKDKKISSVAKQVTSRLYQAPEPKFKYVPKTKEKDFKTIPRTKVIRDKTTELKPRTVFDRTARVTKSESPQRVTGKRTSPAPSRNVDIKKRLGSAPQRDQKSKVGPKTKDSKEDKNQVEKQDKNTLKVTADRNKHQGQNRANSPSSRLSPPTRQSGAASSPTRATSAVSPTARPSGTLSSERLIVSGSNIVRTSPLRQMASATSLASVPESVAENEDSDMGENKNEQNMITSYVVKKRQKKGRANFIDDDFRCHSAPDSHRTSQALDDYTDEMHLQLQSGISNSNRITPILTTSLSVDNSMVNTDDADAENETNEMNLEAKAVRNNDEPDNLDSDVEMNETISISDKPVHMYISSEEDSRCIDDMEISQESDTGMIGPEGNVYPDKYNNESSVMDLIENSGKSVSMETSAPLIVESNDNIVLGKRERDDSEKPNDTEIPFKKSKSVTDISDNLSDTNDRKTGVNTDTASENFSEDSLDLNISIDSLEGEKHSDRLTQSLPAYIIRSEKPMSEDSLSGSCDENDDAENGWKEINKEGKLSDDTPTNNENIVSFEIPHTSSNLDVLTGIKADVTTHPTSLKTENIENQNFNEDDVSSTPVNNWEVNDNRHDTFIQEVPCDKADLATKASRAKDDGTNKLSELPCDVLKVENYISDIIRHAKEIYNESVKLESCESLDEDPKTQTLRNENITNESGPELVCYQDRIEEKEVIVLSKPEVIQAFESDVNDLSAISVSEMHQVDSDTCSDNISYYTGYEVNEIIEQKSISDFNEIPQGQLIKDSVGHENDIDVAYLQTPGTLENNETVKITHDYKALIEKGKDNSTNVIVNERNIIDDDEKIGKSGVNKSQLSEENGCKEIEVDTIDRSTLNETENIDKSKTDISEKTSEDLKGAIGSANGFDKSDASSDNEDIGKKKGPFVDENQNVVGVEDNMGEYNRNLVDSAKSVDPQNEDDLNMNLMKDANKQENMVVEDDSMNQSSENEILSAGEPAASSFLQNQNKNATQPEDNKEEDKSPDEISEKDEIDSEKTENISYSDIVSKDSNGKPETFEVCDNTQATYSETKEVQQKSKPDIENNSSLLVKTKSIGVGTSQDLMKGLEAAAMEDNLNQGSEDSFDVDPREELQVLQEALGRLPARSGPQLSTARRATRQRAMIRQQHRGGDSDGIAPLSDEAPISGTQTKNSNRPNSGSRRRKRPSNKAVDKTGKHLKHQSSDDYDSSENDSVYSEDSVDALEPINNQNRDSHNESNLTYDSNDGLEFANKIDRADMPMGSKHKHRRQLSPSCLHQQPDLTEIVDGPDGKRTIGIQACVHSHRNRSISSTRSENSDYDGSITSEGRAMVMSPISLWNSNERSDRESHSDCYSTSSAGYVKHLNTTERDMAVTPRLSTDTSMFSDRSNLEQGQTEVWSSSSSELRPLESFRDDLSYTFETEAMHPATSPLAYVDDSKSQHSSVYIRSPREGDRLIPRPDCSTPTNPGRVVNISFPESQVHQAALLDTETPVKFEVTVHENTTNIEYNIEKTEYKTYSLRNQNEPTIIPDRILINITEKVNSQSEENRTINHREEITMHQPNSIKSEEDSLVLGKSYHASTSSEKESEIADGKVKREEIKEVKNETTEKSCYQLPSKPVASEEKMKLKKSEIENSNYPGSSQGVDNMSATRLGASFNESDYTSDYGTITSVDGRYGYLTLTSDSEESDSVTNSSQPLETKLASCAQQVSLQNEVAETGSSAMIITEESQNLCTTSVLSPTLNIAATQVVQCVFSDRESSENQPGDADSVDNKLDNSNLLHEEGPVTDLGYESMRPESSDEHKEEEQNEDFAFETDSSSVDTVRPARAGENGNFRSQETLANLTGSNENVEEENTQRFEYPDAEVSKLNLSQSSQRHQKLSVSSADEPYLSLEQCESNTSTCSSDYKTPMQSPRQNDEKEKPNSETVLIEVDDVIIPDYYDEKESTPRQSPEAFSFNQAPILTSSPKQSSDVRTASVNTESVPTALQSTSPAISTIKLFESSKDPVHTEAFRKNLEQKIARLTRHVRSLSDSAISSDFTDGDSSSMSPRNSRVYDDKSFFGEKRLIQALRLTHSPTKIRGTLNFDGTQPTKVPFKDSGNVYDDDNSAKVESPLRQRSFEPSPSWEYFVPLATPVGTFPERLIDSLLAIKPHHLHRTHSLDSLSTIINLKPHLARAVRQVQSIENIPGAISPSDSTTDDSTWKGNMALISSDGARSLSPGEIDVDQDMLDDIYNMENVIQVDASQYRKICEKSTSMSILEDTTPQREYHRSLSEGNIDDFEDEMGTSNTSNDSITFVFIKDERTKPGDPDKNKSKQTEINNFSDPSKSPELYESESQHLDNTQLSYCDEFSDALANISGRGPLDSKSEDRISDVLSMSESEESVIEYNQSIGDAEDDKMSTHSASEEIEEIIDNAENQEQMHGSRDNNVIYQNESPRTYTDTSESFVQSRGKYYEEDSEPLRHKFGIDESVLPIPERSMSADNIPKYLKPQGDLMRSRSTGMLDVGVIDEPESESGIFPPALRTETDQTEPSVSLHTMSEGGLDQTSQRSFSDIDASLSNRTSCDVDSENCNSGENSSAIVRSICSKSSSVSSLEEEFTIDYKTNWGKHKHGHSVDSEDEDAVIDEEQQIRRVLDTVQRLICPKPRSVDRGMTTENETNPDCASIGVQTNYPEESPEATSSLPTLVNADQIILPALAAPFRAQSVDSFGLGANGQGLELSEGSRNWCTLGELMVETTNLLRRINDRLPEQNRKGSISSSEDSQVSQVILKKWQEISIQTGHSLEDLTTVGSQTDGEYIFVEKGGTAKRLDSAGGRQNLEHLDIAETITNDILQVPSESCLCEMSVQTDESFEEFSVIETRISSDLTDEMQNVYIQKPNNAEKTVDKLICKETDSYTEEDVFVQDVAPISFSTKEAQKYNSLEKKDSKQHSTARYIPQLKAELGLDQEKAEKEFLMVEIQSPRSQEVKPPKKILPGITLPDTPEIVELRREHAKLMENLRKASDERKIRKEKLQARKKPVDANERSNQTSFSEAKDKNKPDSSERLKTKKDSKIFQVNKNDPETETSSSNSSFVENIIRSDDEEKENISKNTDVVRSDGEEKIASLEEFIEDLVRSDGDDQESVDIVRSDIDDKEPFENMRSDDEDVKHINDTDASLKSMTSPRSTQEFVQINIQVDPSSGVTVKNKTIREPSPKRNVTDKDTNKKRNVKEEHKWEIAGDEFRTVWERKTECRSRSESNASSDNVGNTLIIEEFPADPAVVEAMKLDELYPMYKSIENLSHEIVEDVLENNLTSNWKDISSDRKDISSDRTPCPKEFREEVSESDGRDSPASVIEDLVQPKICNREQHVPNFIEKMTVQNKHRDENDETDSDDKKHLTLEEPTLFEETIVPQVYKRDHSLPASFKFGECSPELVKKFDKEDTKEQGKKLSQEIFKSETSPKLKAQVIREQQRKETSPDFVESIAILPSNLFPHQHHTYTLPQETTGSKENKLPNVLRESVSKPPRFTDDSTQMSLAFSDDCTQTDPDLLHENPPCPDNKDKVSPKYERSTNLQPSVKAHELGNNKANTQGAKTSEEFREELEGLQQERQHIMDLLGLSYLPNSLTVELLEAKLNYCIGQTDLLLDSLENTTESENFTPKAMTDQKQTKDFLSKYRADLKKSKNDIKECREQLNKGRGRGRPAVRGRPRFRRGDILNQQRQAEIDAFKLERLREQQDYARASKHGTPLRGNTPLKGNTPLIGNSPVVTPRSEHSRSSSPIYSPGYMNPREHKAHLVDLRRQLIKDVVEEEIQHSRSCSPSFHTSPPPLHYHTSPSPPHTHRHASEYSLGFSPKVSVSLTDVPGSPLSSPPSSGGSKTYIVAPGSCSLSPVRKQPTYESANPCGSYQNSPDRVNRRRTSPASLDRDISAPIEELLRRSSYSSSSSQRSSSSRPDLPGISPRSHSDPRVPRRTSTSPVPRQLDNPLSLNLDCLQDDETGPYSPYSAYAREHIIPNQRSPPGGVLRGTFELYHDRSDTSSVLSYDSDTFVDNGHRPRQNTLDEDTIKRLRPIRAEDIKARINRHKR